MDTQSCHQKGRIAKEDSIRFLAEGKKFEGLRGILEKWMDVYAGPDWESRSIDASLMLEHYLPMLESAKTLVSAVLSDAVDIIEGHLTPHQQLQAKTLGIPVIFHSTGGIRDFHDWYRDGFFAALRHAINSNQGLNGFLFFTNERMCRSISGQEEGILAFMTANHINGTFKSAMHTEQRKQLHQQDRPRFSGLVEVGGASMQIVFPVRSLADRPGFVDIKNLKESRYVPDEYPDINLLAVSFMQLGASSASGLFIKGLCSKPEKLRGGICYNPCLPKGYNQRCSAGSIHINESGNVAIDETLRANRLKPAATFCSGTNPEISEKASNHLACLASQIDPDLPLSERLLIKGCNTITGTGDFDSCYAEMNSILFSPSLPLPANQEASSTGFDTPSQIFKFVSTSAQLYITGLALVGPIRNLGSLGLLKKPFLGNPDELEAAARTYCSAPVKTNGGLKLYLPNKIVKLTSMTVEDCMKLAMTQSLLSQIYSSKKIPEKIVFEDQLVDKDTGKIVGEFGWHVGAILKQVLDRRYWSREAYELGTSHTLQDRLDETAAQ